MVRFLANRSLCLAGHGDEVLSVWRIIPAVSSALFVLVLGAFSFVLLESSEQRVAGNLGYVGATMRVTVIPADGYVGSEQLTNAVVAFADAHGLSVAYTRSDRTGLVTVLDEHGRFANGDGHVADLLGPVGAGPTVAVSTVLARSPSLTSMLQQPGDPVETGTFEPDVMFGERYPALLFNADARPFGEGVYLIAGADALGTDGDFDEATAQFFQSNGMAVVGLTALDAGTLQGIVRESLRSAYGVVALLFGVVTALTQLFVLLIFAALVRDRSIVAAVLGATRRDVRALVLRRLGGQVLAGSAAGAALSLAVVLAMDGPALTDLRTRIAVVLVTFAGGLVVSLLMGWCVAWREARRVAHVVPS